MIALAVPWVGTGRKLILPKWLSPYRHWALVREFKGHTSGVTLVCATADGKHVLTGSADKTARAEMLLG